MAYPHGMLAERDRLRKQEERKVSLVFGLKKGKVNILHPQPRHPCLEGDKAVDCLALFCYTIGAGKPASFKLGSYGPLLIKICSARENGNWCLTITNPQIGEKRG